MKPASIAVLMLAATVAAAGEPHYRIDRPEDTGRFLARPHPPSKVDREAIEKKMSQLSGLDSALETAETELQRSRASRYSLDPAVKDAAPERIARAQARVNSARLERHRAYDHVIQMTLDAYGLRPPVEDFRGHPAAAPGMTSSLFPWHPRFAEAEVKNPDGSFRQRNEVELTEEPYDGVTDAATGRMYIHRSGFVSDHSTLFRGTPKWNPDALASILVHESAHWVYVMMHAGGHANDASVRLQSEEFALTHQADFLDPPSRSSTIRPWRKLRRTAGCTV